MLKEYKITLDIMRDVKNPFFSVNTNDLDSFKLLMTVTKQNKAVDLTGMSANIAILKPDKKTVFQECEITDAENGKVEVILTSQAYIVPGTHSAELMIYGPDGLVAVTCRFTYKSVQGIMDDDTVESSDEWQAIHKKVDEAQAILDDLRENGTGIDAQARTQLQVLNEKVDENHQQLSAQLAQKAQQSELENIDGGYFKNETKPIIQAHRGYSYDYPENTMLAFRMAVEIGGADGVETDVRLSSDGEFVLIHDTTVNRTTNSTGYVANMTWVDLSVLDASYPSKFGDKFAGREDCKIPTLDDLLEDFKFRTDKHIVLQVYFDSNDKMKEMVDKVNSYNMLERCYFFGQPNKINFIKNYNPKAITLNDGMAKITNYESFLSNAVSNGHSIVSIDILNSTEADLETMIKTIHKSGVKAHGSFLEDNFTENTNKLINLGIDFILSDNPKAVNEVVKSVFPKDFSDIKTKRGDKEDLPKLKAGVLSVTTNTNEVFIGSDFANVEIITKNKLSEVIRVLFSENFSSLPTDTSSWEQGTLGSADGQPSVNDRRIRTKDFIPISTNRCFYLTWATGKWGAYSAHLNIFEYKEDESFIGSTGWVEQPFFFVPTKETRKVKFVFRIGESTDSSTTVKITPEEILKIIPTLKDLIRVKGQFKNISTSPNDWEVGSLASIDGGLQSVNTRLRSSNYQITTDGILHFELSWNPNAFENYIVYANIFEYGKNGFIRSSGWKEFPLSFVTSENTTSLKVVFKADNELDQSRVLITEDIVAINPHWIIYDLW